ncbi:branched-chain amino acid transport system II carrier protein [Fusobacterium gastrosuis]|uniref:branched-chain amino acid transport system II carrier protein n=1 Tax=Fusobacterium gastrosuis TaxID=1755100 RepID=UPI0025E1752B|nr:branched-chain amino acid transport system II carrier protein [uncultured Fusobacterium sp.]MDY5305281.1 branched-chain amino acid transport system II carrier protein [Fusobacterium gastrosuis]
MYKIKDIILTGFAFFAMLFGAGNLIFPPMLGYETNYSWNITIMAFIVTAVGLPLLGILSVSIAGNGLDDFAKKVSPLFSKIFAIILILAIGPMLAIPRTGATAYEITFLYKGIDNEIYKHVYLILYFIITYIFSVKPTKVIDRVGKILTPVLLLVLTFIIIKGVFFSEFNIMQIAYKSPFKKGFLEGYQTMDTLASIAYATIILKSIRMGRNLTNKQEFSFLLKSSIIAVLLLALVYGAFAYIGAGMHPILNIETKTELLVKMTIYLLGEHGFILLAVCVAGACLTTAIGLVATVGDYFSNLTGISYTKIVTFTTILSYILSILGVEGIIKISVPILVLIYPVTMSLILLNIFRKFIRNDYAYKGTVIFTGIVGLIESLLTLGIDSDILKKIIEKIPLSEYGLTFIVPGIVGFLLFYVIFKNKNQER